MQLLSLHYTTRFNYTLATQIEVGGQRLSDMYTARCNQTKMEPTRRLSPDRPLVSPLSAPLAGRFFASESLHLHTWDLA